MDIVRYGSEDGQLDLGHYFHPYLIFPSDLLLISFLGFYKLAISATFQIIFSFSSPSQVIFAKPSVPSLQL